MNGRPDLFLSKLKGVLDKLPRNPKAFHKFTNDEIGETFGGTKALLVPGTQAERMSLYSHDLLHLN